ncbi:flagellar assembly peptidoglycan hydrolase FlgJ, partial [Bordetella hinzii]|nr:flagellar assembly peptidoglycan hydrolase FlgJ [Bordetella hinzii]
AGYATDPRYAEKLINIMSQLRASVARVDFSGNP